MDVSKKIGLAQSIFSNARGVASGHMRMIEGTATADSSDGKVPISIGGESIDCSCFASVKSGDTVTVFVQDGNPTVLGKMGWGDNLPGGGVVEETDPTVPSWAKQPTKPTYTAAEVGALPNTTVIPTVPTNVSAFANDAGYLIAIPDEYVTETGLAALWNRILSMFAKKSDITTPAVLSSVGTQYAIGSSSEKVSTRTEWASATSPLSQRQRACCYGNGYYVVCGMAGELAYSTNATAWTKITAFTSDVITGITYGKGTFVAIDSVGSVWFSDGTPNGWQNAGVTMSNILEAVTYANNRFVIVGDGGLVAFSDDGRSWTEASTGQNNDLYSLAYGDGKFVAGGMNGTILMSLNGSTWTNRSDASVTQQFRAAAYGGGKFVVGGASGIIRYSEDGSTWHTATTSSTSTVSYIRAICYCEGTFYAVMYLSNGKGEVWTSSDAASWTVQKTTTGRLWCLAEGEDVLVASGDSGAIYILDLGIEWLDREPEIADGQHLWQRNVASLSDGDVIYGEAVCVAHAEAPVDLSGYATTSAVNTAQITANNAISKADTVKEIADDAASAAATAQEGVDNINGVIQRTGLDIFDGEAKTIKGWTQEQLAYYVTSSELAAKGYLTSIPSEYITESELKAKGYITAVPSEYVTETELANKGYLTSVPSEYVTDSELTAKGYATQTWVNGKGYLTAVPSGYATQDWVTGRGYITGISKTDVTNALGYTPPTTNTTYGVVSTTADGLAPKRDGSTTKFLRADGSWAVPPDTNTTYTLGSFGITATAAQLNAAYSTATSAQSTANEANSTATAALTVANGVQDTAQTKPVVLYENATGTTGTVTLAQSAANFSRIEIIAGWSDCIANSVTVYSPNGKTVDVPIANATASSWNIARVRYAISGTTMTASNNYRATGSGNYSTNQVYCKAVLGYR